MLTRRIAMIRYAMTKTPAPFRSAVVLVNAYLNTVGPAGSSVDKRLRPLAGITGTTCLAPTLAAASVDGIGTVGKVIRRERADATGTAGANRRRSGAAGAAAGRRN